MRKKLLAVILSVFMCCSLFAGCALIEHNNEKDARQVVATIDSIVDTHNGVTYESGKRYIYKSDLISACNSYAASYVSNYNLTLEQAVNRLLDELVTRELLLIEAERLLEQGEIEWTQKEENQKQEYIYSAIDSRLTTLRGDIYSDFDETAPSSDDEEDVSAETTYPTPEAETTEDDYTYYETDERGNIVYEDKKDKDGNIVYEQAVDQDGVPMYAPDGVTPVMVPVQVPKYIEWVPSEANYPCMWGSEDQKSLDREAVNRFLSVIKTLAEDDFKATKEDKAKFAEDDKKIEDIINTRGIENVYPMLGGTHYMEYLVGRTAEQSILLTLLQEYIVGNVTVTDQEVVDAYNTQLRNQQEKYRDNQQAYQTDLSGGSTTMLYMRDDSYFYVKHILLPFSEEQTAYLAAYKADPRNAGKDATVMRDTQMVNETVVYPHVNGEDDRTDPKTVNEVFDEIYSAMYRVKNNPKEAERLFDSYTYKYNTDTGAFGYGSQYAVKKNDDEGHSGYMEEFYDGAMELYNNYSVGDVLPEYVVTDYGVHIMYFSQDVTPGYIRQLKDYLTPGAYKTVRETFYDTIKSTKENAAFTAWQNERITYYQDNEKVVTKYTKRYKSIYEE